MYATAPKPKDSLAIVHLDEKTFCDFARRHGTSDEIGRIATFFDDAEKKSGNLHCPPRLYGLSGCGRLAVIVCLTVHDNVGDDHQACRLDSVITDKTLRKRGLASLLIAHAFLDALADEELSISTLHSHAVHPGTVRMLKQLLFSNPPLKGAPLVTVYLTPDVKPKFVSTCEKIIQDRTSTLKLNCAFCLQGNKRKARYWCIP